MAIQLIDTEVELVNMLSTALSVAVATRIPSPRPDEFIQVRRQAGGATFIDASLADVLRDKPTIDIYCYGTTEEEAWELAARVRPIMLSLPTDQPLSVPVYKSTESVCTWADDILDGVTNSNRVWLSYDLSIRIYTD
jgi:hypothetical protein